MKPVEFRSLRSTSAPPPGGGPAVCPHCWMVNPGAFNLCVRCGADMRTWLQESGGLRRTAPVQSPVPVAGGPGLSLPRRILMAFFVVVLVLGHLFQLLPAVSRLRAAPTPSEVQGAP